MAWKEVDTVVEESLQAEEPTAYLYLPGSRMLTPDTNIERLCSEGSEWMFLLLHEVLDASLVE